MSLPPVVLTPGYEDDARKMSWLARSLTRLGRAPLILSPQPADGSVGIEFLAAQFAAMLEDALGPTQPVALCGFSMGGLIHRVYGQQLGGAGRITQWVTVATPHRGTWTPYLLRPKPALAQMRVGSAFLADLNRDVAALAARSFTAFWTPFDLSVMPPSHAYLPGLPQQRLWSPFHGTLLRDPWVLRRLAAHFARG
jgi:triacylglycerol lipase